MIFVTVGTQDKEFKRLFCEIDRLIESKIITDEVIAQIGHTKFVSDKMKIKKFFTQTELKEIIKNANFVITHGGVGTILECVKENKKVIAVPRLKKYKEHVNDHQIQIIQNFNERKLIVGIEKVEDLEDAINKINNFKPKQFESNNKNFVNKLENSIIM